MINHRSIATKIFACFVCVIAVTLFVGALTYRSLSRVNSTEQWTRHTYQVLGASKDLRATILRQEASARGYLLTHDRSFLAGVAGERTLFEQSLRSIEALTADNPSQQSRLRQLASLVSTWETQLLSDDAHVAAGTNVGGEGLLGRIMAKVHDLDGEEEGLLALRMRAQGEAFARASFLNLFAPFISLVIAVVLSIALHRMIAAPIRSLTLAMGRLADGDTGVRIPNMDWHEEIGAMGRAVQVFRTGMIDAEQLRAGPRRAAAPGGRGTQGARLVDGRPLRGHRRQHRLRRVERDHADALLRPFPAGARQGRPPPR